VAPDTELMILKDGVRRRLEMPFRICLSHEAATTLREELKKATHKEWNYGWIDINPRVDGPVTDSTFKEWNE
jgi:hypothetical protein